MKITNADRLRLTRRALAERGIDYASLTLAQRDVLAASPLVARYTDPLRYRVGYAEYSRLPRMIAELLGR